VKTGRRPWQFASNSKGERHGRIEVRTRNRAEDENQHDEDRAGRDGVAEQRQRDVTARELLRHDSRADHGGQQERRAEPFGGKPLTRCRHQVAAALGSVTRSPSSLTNVPCCGGSNSNTASEGRQSRTPFGVTTIGRLIRIGCSIIASSSVSSPSFGSASPSS